MKKRILKNTLIAICSLTLGTAFAQNKMVCLDGFSAMNVSDKSYADAMEVFEILRNAPISQSTHKHRANNCENRAGFSYKVLQAQGFEPINFWLFKEGLIEESYDTEDKVKKSKGFTYYTGLRKKPAGWGYHVAAGIILTIDGEVDTLVYDPWTQDTLVKLSTWALDFYQAPSSSNGSRTAYIFPVDDNYSFYGKTDINQVSTSEIAWSEKLDTGMFQTHCGLCGITPNGKCKKRRFSKKIRAKEVEINKYLAQFDIIIK